MSTLTLDPWRDAETIAYRLGRTGSRLVVVLGAEAWCQKCRDLRPAFDRLAAQSHEADLWLWLDLEDHAEFLGEHIPEDLPMLLVYSGATLSTQRRVDSPEDLLRWDRPDGAGVKPIDPGIRDRLLQQDWAT